VLLFFLDANDPTDALIVAYLVKVDAELVLKLICIRAEECQEQVVEFAHGVIIRLNKSTG
jgi:hypothetical protein